MSHFTVLVIGEEPELQLAPYHEFECTGEVDEYVQSVDKLEEAKEGFAQSKTTRMKSPTGELLEVDDFQFFRNPTPDEAARIESRDTNGMRLRREDFGDGKGMTVKVAFVPEGYEPVEVPLSQVESLAEYVESWYGFCRVEHDQPVDLEDSHKYGWYKVDADGNVIEAVDRTNPNKKWDWYVLGGRWTGFFKLKAGADGVLGRPGLFTKGADAGQADAAVKGSIDFDSMRLEAETEAAADYDRIHAVLSQHEPVLAFPEIAEANPELSRDEQAAKYRDQPGLKALREASIHVWDLQRYLVDRADFIRVAGLNAGTTFAVVKDGKWYERGSMGWFGFVADEKSTDAWVEEFSKLIADLPDDTLLSVYDCHI